MALRVASMGGAGFGGAALYHNKDLFEDLLRENGLIQGVPRGVGDAHLHGSVNDVSNQLGALTLAQRQTQQYLLSQGQPMSVLGVPVWKVVSVAGVATTVYLKACGYELRDLVYVSKKHFNSVTDTLRVQIESVEEMVGAVKAQLFERIGLVEERVDEAQRSIENRLESEGLQLRADIAEVGGQVSEVSKAVEGNTKKVDDLSGGVAGVRDQLASVHKDVGLSLTKLRNDLEEVQRTTVMGNRVMRGDIQGVHSKVDSLHENTRREFQGFSTSLSRVSKGLGLLCELVCTQANNGTPSESLLEELQVFGNGERVFVAPASEQPKHKVLRKRSNAGLAQAIAAK